MYTKDWLLVGALSAGVLIISFVPGLPPWLRGLGSAVWAVSVLALALNSRG